MVFGNGVKDLERASGRCESNYFGSCFVMQEIDSQAGYGLQGSSIKNAGLHCIASWPQRERIDTLGWGLRRVSWASRVPEKVRKYSVKIPTVIWLSSTS